MSRIAVLKSDKLDEQSAAFALFTELQKISPDEYELVRYKNIAFHVSYGSVSVTNDGQSIADIFDLVYARDFRGYEFERNALALYFQHSGTKVINSDVTEFQDISKLTQYLRFTYAGVIIPETYFAKGQRLIDGVHQHLRYPVVVKSIVGSSGRDNFLVHSAQELQALLQEHPETKFIAQEYIPNDNDLRFIVCGDQVACVSTRHRTNQGHKNNVGLGARKQYVPLQEVSDELKKLAVTAAKAVRREVCGVDIVVDKHNGKAYVLEANFNFGVKRVAGEPMYEAKAVADYLGRQARK